MVVIESAYYIGNDGQTFPSASAAKEALRDNETVKQLCKDHNKDIDGLIAEGIISIKPLLLG